MDFTENTEIIELGNGIYARIHKDLTNSGIIIGDDGVLVIDSLRVPSFAKDLKSDIKKITDKPIKYVIDTHSLGSFLGEPGISRIYNNWSRQLLYRND